MADIDITGRVVVDASQAEGAFDRVADKAEQMGREVADAARQAGKEVDGMGDGANTSAEKFTRAEARIRDSIKRSTQELNLLGKTASEKLEFKIADKGLDSSKFTSYIAELKKAEAAQMALGAASVRSGSVASASLDSMGMSARATAAALRGVPAQFTDIITSLQGGQAPLTVFLQQGGQLKDMFGGAGNAARALGGYVVGLINPFTLAAGAVAALGLAYFQGSKEADAYNKALITTGNASGSTAAQMQQMAQRISSVVGTQSAAAATLAQLAGSSRIAAENFEYFGTVALKVEKTVGTAVAETVKQFAELGKSPVEASKKLNEETNYLTQSIYEQIKALKDQGREAEAAATAQKAYADALNSRSDQMTQNLGLIERAWRGITGAAKGAWDAMLNVGRSDSLGDQLAAARAALEQKLNTPLAVDNPAMQASREKGIAALRNQIALLTEQERLLKRGAESQAARAQAEKAAIEATDALGKANEKALTKQEQMNKALGEYRANLEKVKAVNPNSALLDPAQVAKSEKAIREQFTERTAAVRKGNDELQKQQDLIAKLSGLDPSFSRDWEILSQAYKSGVLSLDELVKKQAELLAKQPAMTAQIKAQAEAEKERAKAAEELTKTMEDYAKAQQAGVSSAIDAATQAETQLAQYGLLKSEVQELTLAYLEQSRESAALAGEDVSNIDKRIAAQKRLIAATRGLEAREISDTAAKDAAKEWERAAGDINRSLTDALLRGFESGKDFAKNLRDTVVNMFKTMVLRPVISAIINPISGALTGMMGLSGAAQAGQGGNAASTAMSAASMFGAGGLGGSLAAGAGWMTGATTLGGSLSAGASLIGAGGAGILPGMGMIAGALGPIAIGIALLSSLIKKSTPHTGGIGAYSAASGATTGSSVGLAFGIDQKHYTQAGEDLSTNVAKSIVGILDATATTFGKQAGYYAATAFADDSSKDGAWGALRIKFGEKVLLDWADTAVRDANVPREFADGEAGSKEYLAAVAASARDALVQAIGDVDWATDMLKGLGDSVSLESLAQTVQQINAAKAAFDALGKNIVGFGALTDGAISQLVKAAGSIDGLVSAASAYYDNFYSEEEKRANVIRQIAASLKSAGVEMSEADIGRTTREQFRRFYEAVVDAKGVADPAAIAILNVAGAIASITPVADKAASAIALAESGRAADRKDRLVAEREREKQEAEALQKQITTYAEGADAFATLRNSLLLAGDAAALLAAETERAFANPTGKYTVGGREYNAPRWEEGTTAAGYNYQYGMMQRRLTGQAINDASFNALRIQNVSGLLGELFQRAAPNEYDTVTGPIRQAIQQAIVGASGDMSNAVRDAVSGAALYAATSGTGFSTNEPGLAAIRNARAAASTASLYSRDSETGLYRIGGAAVAYGEALGRLEGALFNGRINAETFDKAVEALAGSLPGAAQALGTLEDRIAAVEGASYQLGTAGLNSINYYFGQLGNIVQEMADAAAKAAEPIALTTAAIGRLSSAQTAFGESAKAALEGFGGGGLAGSQMLGNAGVQSTISRSQLIAESAGIAAGFLTTADAAAAALKIAKSPAFDAMDKLGIRDASLLLDGVGQYNADGFERAFLRISDALAKSTIDEEQYKALFGVARDMFEGVPEETSNLISAMEYLRDAMAGFADGLLIDKAKTTLTAGATLAEMQRQYGQAFSGASTGDTDAIGKYQSLANGLLDKNLYANQAEYNATFGRVYGDARQLESVGVNTLAAQQGGNVVAEIKAMNEQLSKRVEELDKNLTAALAQIAKNTSETSKGVDRMNTVGLPA